MEKKSKRKQKMYKMPAMTEQRKEEIIEGLEETIKTERHSLYGYAAKISLAVLTSEAVVWIKPNSLGVPRMANIDAVTIPFVPEYPVPLFLHAPAEALKPIKLPEPHKDLSEKEKATYALIMKDVEEELFKQGYQIKK